MDATEIDRRAEQHWRVVSALTRGNAAARAAAKAARRKRSPRAGSDGRAAA